MKATIKQALSMIRENRLFTGIYIAGTALAIASTTIMAIIYYVKIANIYPETNRDKICYLNYIKFEKQTMLVEHENEEVENSSPIKDLRQINI